MIKRYCDRCGQQIDEGVRAWYVLELHGTDGEFRHKELCEECYAYLCEKDEVPTADRKTEPITHDDYIESENDYLEARCLNCANGGSYKCSKCDGEMYYKYDKDEPQTVRSNLEPFRVDEPQTEMTTEQIVNELLSIKQILDDGKMPKQTHDIRTNTHECVKDTHDKTEPQTDCDNCMYLHCNYECAGEIVHKMIDDAVIAEDVYPDLRQRMHDAVDEYEPQTERRCGNCKHLTYRWNKTWCDIKCDNPHDMVCDKWERSE